MKRHIEPCLHLMALTDSGTSMALAKATEGAIAWEGLGLLSGSSINDIMTAFFSHYSSENWGAALCQELPELRDEDIDWWCGLTGTMEPKKPVLRLKEAGRLRTGAGTACGSKRRRGRSAAVPSDPQQDSQDSLPTSTPMEAQSTGWKRKLLPASLPSRRSARLTSEQSAPGRDTGAPPKSATKLDQVTGQPPPPSPLAASQRPHRSKLSRARRKLDGVSPVSMRPVWATACSSHHGT